MGENVARKLFADKLVVRHIVIESVDHPVAIAPRVRHGEVGGFARGVGVTGQIEPVPAPSLAIVRRRQQPFDQFRESIG